MLTDPFLFLIDWLHGLLHEKVRKIPIEIQNTFVKWAWGGRRLLVANINFMAFKNWLFHLEGELHSTSQGEAVA